MKLSTLIAIVALSVSSHAFALDSISDIKEPSGQDIALVEQEAGSGFVCIQSGLSDSYICQQKNTENAEEEIVVSHSSVICDTRHQVAKSEEIQSTNVSNL